MNTILSKARIRSIRVTGHEAQIKSDFTDV